MILYKKAIDLHNYLESQRQLKNNIGFVPTMGALHEGHISLVKAAKSTDTVTVCSIFVNPTQFNDPADFEKYPVTLDTDIALLVAAGCDVLYLPAVPEIYPEGLNQVKTYELGEMEVLLEGQYRPGHFQGVCQVVDRLLCQVNPDDLFLGRKDYQQCMVINRLIELTGRASHLKLHVCPTLREPDGLAMSSRNRRLNAGERQTATTIYKALNLIKENCSPGDLTPVRNTAQALLDQAGFRTDYLTIADATTLHPCFEWDGQRKIVALAAAFLNEVRLIDNLPLN